MHHHLGIIPIDASTPASQAAAGPTCTGLFFIQQQSEAQVRVTL